MKLWTWLVNLRNDFFVRLSLTLPTFSKKNEVIKVSDYFKEEETKGLSTELVNMLNEAREISGVPFIITSGYRDPQKNDGVGGVKDSAHTKGLAVDIRASDEILGKMIAFGLGKAGFVRAGFYTKHIHVDIDKEKPQVIWNGGESH